MRRTYFYLSVAFVLLISCNKEEHSILATATRDDKVVVILGSSTAFGTGATPIDSSWVNLLRSKFRKDQKNITLHNLALGGYTTYHIMPSNFPPTIGKPALDKERNIDKALNLKPDLIIINLPSNDIAHGFSYNEIISNYKTICSLIKDQDVRFLVTSTQPRNFSEASVRSRLATLNSAVRNAFSENTIDFYNLLTDPELKIKSDLDYGDGIHLNNKGHKIIFEEFLKDKRMRFALGY